MPAATVADPERISALGRGTSPAGSVHAPDPASAAPNGLVAVRTTRTRSAGKKVVTFMGFSLLPQGVRAWTWGEECLPRSILTPMQSVPRARREAPEFDGRGRARNPSPRLGLPLRSSVAWPHAQARLPRGKTREAPGAPHRRGRRLQEIRGRVGRLVAFSPNSTGSFNRAVRRRSGCVVFHVHRLRHTFASRYLESGGQLAAL